VVAGAGAASIVNDDLNFLAGNNSAEEGNE